MPDAPAFIPLKENNMLLHEHDEQPKTMLSREAFLLGGGIKDGFVDRLKEATENPGLTTLEFSGAALLGAGLRAMSMAGGRLAAASKVGAGALQFLAVADGIRRVVPTAYAMGDTALNPDHYLENRAVVARNIGSACFDYPLMAAGGVIGSSAAGFAPRAISSLGDSFRTAKAINVKIETPHSCESLSEPKTEFLSFDQEVKDYREMTMGTKPAPFNVKFGQPLGNAYYTSWGGMVNGYNTPIGELISPEPITPLEYKIESSVRNHVYPALWTSWEKEKSTLYKHKSH